MKQSEKALIRACGGYCGGCLDYLAYVNSDEELKKQLAEGFSKQFGMHIEPEDVGCLGCHGTIHRPWCASCSTQRCTEGKGILTCAFCDELPCEELEKHYGERSENRVHLLRQREIGLEKWLEEMRKQQDWKKSLNADPTNWLLEPDDPGVRYLALRDLVEADTKELATAIKEAHTSGPIAAVLSEMDEEGYWARPGAGYSPMYTGTVWAVILLAQLGAVIDMDKRIATACAYILDHSLTEYGQFTGNGSPSGTLDCLQGNLCYSLLDLGCTDPRLDKAYEWMARSVTGEGVAPNTDGKAKIRYYAEKCGPVFACNGTYGEPCAWGAVKVMLAFGKLPVEKRAPLMNNAIKTGVDFLFSKDPAKADYPFGKSRKPTGKPSSNWWKFGFPVYYITDILQNAEALARLGCGKDPRLANALKIILDKQDDRGRWPMEYSYTGKTWGDFGPKKQPNKWVTLRALRVLKSAGQ